MIKKRTNLTVSNKMRDPDHRQRIMRAQYEKTVKISPEQEESIRKALGEGTATAEEITKRFDISRSMVSQIKNRKRKLKYPEYVKK